MPAKLANSKLLKAGGKPLHGWQLVKIEKGIAYWRCYYCDFKDRARWPHTPDPRPGLHCLRAIWVSLYPYAPEYILPQVLYGIGQ